MRKWVVVLVWVLAALLVLGVAKDLIVKSAVESGTRIITGLNLKIGSFRVGILGTLIDIRNLRILNPPGFRDKVMLDMPRIYIDYDLPALFKRKIYLTDVSLDMKEFIVVRNEKGELNLDSLKVVKAQKAGTSPHAQNGGKAPEIRIDRLHLKIGKVIFKDYSKPGAPRITEYNVDVDDDYRDITDPYALVSLIVVRGLSNTSVSSLTNFDLNGLKNSVSGVLDNAQKVTAHVTETAKMATETVNGVKDTMSEAGGAVKDVFKDVFGSK